MASRDEFRYAKSGDLSIAYATYGEGPPDVVFAHGFAGNVYRFAGKVGTWSQVLEQMGATNSPSNSDYGIGLALNHDGRVELVGADGEDLSGGQGAVFAYEFSGHG